MATFFFLYAAEGAGPSDDPSDIHISARHIHLCQNCPGLVHETRTEVWWQLREGWKSFDAGEKKLAIELFVRRLGL